MAAGIGWDPSSPAGDGKVGFLLTEVDAELPGSPSSPNSKAALASPASPTIRAALRASAAGDRFVYRVEDATLPPEVVEDGLPPAPLPATIPLEKVMTNIVQNLSLLPMNKQWSENSRNSWFKDFKSPPSRAIIGDTYWFCICWYFKPGRHPDVEQRLFDRISANFVTLFTSVAPSAPSRKDFFFRCFADAVAQAVLYAMYLAYPKSRGQFTDRFRKDLVTRASYWTNGMCPEFVDTSHWKLNLGGGDVLQGNQLAAWQRNDLAGPSSPPAGANSGSQVALALQGSPGADSLSGKSKSLAQRAPRPLKNLRYSPLIEHFLRARSFSSINLVPTTKICVTMAEDRSKLMDAKHAMLVDRASASREYCDRLAAESDQLNAEMRRQERQRALQAQTAKKRLEIRRREVLRSDPHEYANYLVSLHLLQHS